MYRHHNFEERLNIVSRIFSGEPIKALCSEFGIHKEMVRQWYLRYQKYGESELRGTRSYHYTVAEKTKIVEEFTVKGLPLQEVCLRYDLNRETISYNISKSPDLEQVYDMPDKAFARFDYLDRLILHSDQGWQYQHYGYRKRLEEHGIIQSMSRKGNCLDNAMAENFFGIMKSELLYAEKFESPQAFIKAWDQYIITTTIRESNPG